ncbi:Cyclin-dependent kinases regulatory subunit (Cell division control protein cks1) [Hanseniaspora valbyensis]
MSGYHQSHFEGRKLTDIERNKLVKFQDNIHYSQRYYDDDNEYRHVMLPKQMLKEIPTDYFNNQTGTLRLLTEDEWRNLGITQSLGWQHYENHTPEPHILLFKRPKNFEEEQNKKRLAQMSQQQQQQ